MASVKAKPVEIDPSLAALLLKGVLSDIETGKVEVLVFEKIPHREATTTVIVSFQEKKK